jgi:peptide/nickel transport system permease protein
MSTQRHIQFWSLVSLLFGMSTLGLFVKGDRSVDLDQTLQPPSSEHWMGTDELGRDLFSRVIEGTSLSIRLSLGAWLLALIIGLCLGTLAGYNSGTTVDLVISWLISLSYITPFFVFLIAILGITGPGLLNAYLVLLLFAWAPSARQTRVTAREMRNAPYVTAARSLGYSQSQLIAHVFLPSVFRPALIASIATLPEIIALDAALSFFGLGAQPPLPALGKILADGIEYVYTAWWVFSFPVLALSGLCLIARTLSSIVSDAIKVQ